MIYKDTCSTEKKKVKKELNLRRRRERIHEEEHCMEEKK